MNFVVTASVHKMITTKTGDLGKTTCGNKRLDKDDLLVEVVGNIDELQAILEIVGEEKVVDDLSQIMGEIGSEIRFKKYDLRIKQMEKEIDSAKQNVNGFLKFKKREALELNWARTVCRRVERRIVALNKIQKVDLEILKYFNRLSDYLFLRAREKDL